MKSILISVLIGSAISAAFANTAPTPVVVSAAMRPGTTFMDVVYRVNDPDDATVKVRVLAFVDGVRSFANVLRPVTFVEGTAAKIGDAIPSNTNHTLTWDVGADWSIDLGQVKFEVLCRDARGLLGFDWISIPAAGGQPALTISKDAPSDASVLSALFWQYADGDPGLTVTSGSVAGSASSGAFAATVLANGTSLRLFAAPYVLKQMNLDPASSFDVSYATNTARAGLLNTGSWHAANRNYSGVSMVVGWGSSPFGQTTIPTGLSSVVAIAAGTQHCLALSSGGTVAGWGDTSYGATTPPVGLSGVTAIAAGSGLSLALKSDGTVVAWGYNGDGQTTIPPGLSGVTAIAAGGGPGGSQRAFSLALKSDGTVVGWGYNGEGATTIPAGLSGVTAIAAGSAHGLALKSDGTVVGWGANSIGQTTIPAGLSGVIAIAAAHSHSLALKSNGAVVAWGWSAQTAIPAGLSGVTAIAAGFDHSLALKSDGTVVVWGSAISLPGMTVPAGLSGVTAIAAGNRYSLALKPKAP